MLWFPRPNLLLYTVLVLPALYTASKLYAQSGTSSASIFCMVVLPLPVIMVWVYVLFSGSFRQQVQRSRSAILQAYSPQLGTKGSSTACKPAAATLALLGDAGDNPTLIIRDRKPGEEEFDRFAMAGESSEDMSDDETHHQGWGKQVAHSSNEDGGRRTTPAGRLWRPPAVSGFASNMRPSMQRVEYLPGQSADGGAGGRALAEGLEPSTLASLSGVLPTITASESTDGNTNCEAAVASRPLFLLPLQDGAEGECGLAAETPHQPGLDRAPPITRQQTWVGSESGGSACMAAGASADAVRLHFLLRFGFLVDDLVGGAADVVPSRVHYLITCLYLINFLQRCSTAFIFGVFHAHWISVVQIGLLLTLHLTFIVYLLAVRPYCSLLLLSSEVIAYGCEVVILVSAALALKDPYSSSIRQTLLVCYYLDIGAVLLPDVLHLCRIAWESCQRLSFSHADGSQHCKQESTQAQRVELDREPDAAATAAASAALHLTSNGQ